MYVLNKCIVSSTERILPVLAYTNHQPQFTYNAIICYYVVDMPKVLIVLLSYCMYSVLLQFWILIIKFSPTYVCYFILAVELQYHACLPCLIHPANVVQTGILTCVHSLLIFVAASFKCPLLQFLYNGTCVSECPGIFIGDTTDRTCKSLIYTHIHTYVRTYVHTYYVVKYV